MLIIIKLAIVYINSGYRQPIAASIEEIDSDEEVTEFSDTEEDNKVELT